MKETMRSVLGVLLGLSLTCQASAMTPDERMSDFEQGVSILKSSYSMVEYKKKAIGVDLSEVSARYRASMAKVTNDDDFYDLMNAFFCEFRDGHLNFSRPSTMSARLGFSIKRADGKAIIAGVNRKVLAEDVFAFKVGDELVSMDGKPVATLVRELAPFESGGTESNVLGATMRKLPVRWGDYGRVPTGICKIEVRPYKAEETQTVQIPWIVKGRALPGLSFHGGAVKSGRSKLLQPGVRNPDAAIDPQDAGPEAAPQPLWAPDDALPVESPLFAAAMFDSPKGLIGYIRIPDFSPDDTDAAIVEFRRVLTKLKFCRGMVLDLNDNPGGSVLYGLSMAGCFTDKVIQTPKKAELANRSVLNDYRGYAESTDPHWKQMATYHAEAIEKAMAAGLSMTEPIPLSYRPSQVPDPEVQFTGPVLILTNDQSVSCGDLFPAVLKDNGRAKTFGHTTAGAGGSVGQYGPLSYSGAKLSVTINLTQRVNGTYIENVGVEVDFPYDVTQHDVASKYAAYRKAYTDAILGMMK